MSARARLALACGLVAAGLSASFRHASAQQAPQPATAQQAAQRQPAQAAEQQPAQQPPAQQQPAQQQPRPAPQSGARQAAAQQPPAQQPPATGPAATQPANGANGRPAANRISMNFQDTPIDAILNHLSEAAGFSVIKDATVSLNTKVTVISRQPVTPDEAVVLLNSVLKGPGYTAVQTGRTLKVLSRATAEKANLPVHFGADPSQIAETDTLITQVIPVKKVDAVRLRADLTPLTDAIMTANAGSNTLMITDTSANVRRMVQIIASLDRSEVGVTDIKVIKLKNADATTAARLITEIFAPPQQQQGRGQGGQGFPFGGGGFPNFGGGGGGFPNFGGGGGRGGFGGRGGDGGGRGGQGGGRGGGNDPQADLQGRITASADARTNAVVVTGPPATLELVKTILDDLDKDPITEQTFFMYSLKNAQAANVEQVLNAMFLGGVGGGIRGATGAQRGGALGGGFGGFGGFGTQNRGGAGGRTTGGRTTGGLGGGFGGGAFGGGGFGGGAFGGGGFGGGGLGGGGFGGGGFGNRGGFGGGGFGGGIGRGGMAGGVLSDLAGQVYVVADIDTNSLLVTTATKHQARVKQILAELDRPVPQVLIKVLIAEVTHDDSRDLGVEFSILNLNNNGIAQLSAGTNFLLNENTTGAVVRVARQEFTATIRAMEAVGKLDVLSRPYILASDNQLASILVGQEVPRPTNSRTTDAGNTLTDIDYRDVGISLNVVPHINPDGLVILEVVPEVSQLTGTTIEINEQVSAPIIAKRSAYSRVGIKNGQTIVIGGLMEDRTTVNVRKVPILGDIPFVGYAFRREIKTKAKTELLIFLTPHVAPQPDLLKGMSQDEMGGTRLTPNAVAPGVFDEHMRNMQRGATSLEPSRPDRPFPPGEAAEQEAERRRQDRRRTPSDEPLPDEGTRRRNTAPRGNGEVPRGNDGPPANGTDMNGPDGGDGTGGGNGTGAGGDAGDGGAQGQE